MSCHTCIRVRCEHNNSWDSPSGSTQISPVHLALPFTSNGIHDICHCHMDYRLLWPARKDSILGCFAAVGTSREPKLKSPSENQAWISFRRTYTCNPHFLLPTFYEPVTTLALQSNRDHGNREMECGISPWSIPRLIAFGPFLRLQRNCQTSIS